MTGNGSTVNVSGAGSSVSGTANVRVTENVRCTESVRGTEGARGSKGVKGTESARGTVNVRCTERVRGTESVRSTKSHLKKFTVKLRTLSPVFIGGGKEISKNEYIYIKNGHRVIIPDFNKFSRFLIQNNLIDEYSSFMRGEGRYHDLFSWIRGMQISSTSIDSFKAYELSAGDAVIPGKSLREINLFIKNNFNEPYVPGSSIKGALRTAILAKMIQENHSLRNKQFNMLNASLKKIDRFSKYALSKESKDIEIEYFNKLSFVDKKENMVNSIMRGLRVSDSKPLSTKDLVLCAKIDVCRNGKEIPLPTYRECIKPGTVIEFDITLDSDYLGESYSGCLSDGGSSDTAIDMDYILSAITTFSEIQYKFFISKFLVSQSVDRSVANDGLELFVGGGAGFVSKTFVYPLGGEKGLDFTADFLELQFGKHKGDKADGVSPHTLKCTKFGGKYYMLGRCEVMDVF